MRSRIHIASISSPPRPSRAYHTPTYDFIVEYLNGGLGENCYREPITTPARTIVDSAAAAIGPEQVEMAVTQAMERGLTTRGDLETQAAKKSARVRQLIARALASGSQP